MSIQSDIKSALSGVAGGRVYPYGEVPELPEGQPAQSLIVYRRTDYAPLNVLSGASGMARSNYIFECWGIKVLNPPPVIAAKVVALSLAADVRSGIAAASAIINKTEIEVSGEDYDPAMLEVMEPIAFSFWHNT